VKKGETDICASLWAGGIVEERRLGWRRKLCKVSLHVFVRWDLAAARRVGEARMRYGQCLARETQSREKSREAHGHTDAALWPPQDTPFLLRISISYPQIPKISRWIDCMSRKITRSGELLIRRHEYSTPLRSPTSQGTQRAGICSTEITGGPINHNHNAPRSIRGVWYLTVLPMPCFVRAS
jgi:hypothetical protein